jgi:hypothetical protein
MIFIHNGNSIQRLTKASFTTAKRKHKKRAISKAARQTILDMGYSKTQARRHQNRQRLLL